MDTCTILTLKVSPADSASEDIVRISGGTPKNIMRLLNHEPVSKLHDYLRSKWNITTHSLRLLYKGQPMDLSSTLLSYADQPSGNLPIQYELIRDCEFDKIPRCDVSDISQPSTAAPTPQPITPEARETLDIHQPLDETIHIVPQEEVKRNQKQDLPPRRASQRKLATPAMAEATTKVPGGSELIGVSLEAQIVKLESLYRELKDREQELYKRERDLSERERSFLERERDILLTNQRKERDSIATYFESQANQIADIAARLSTLSTTARDPDALIREREMSHKERDSFTRVFESQAKLVTAMQSQLMETCMANSRTIYNTAPDQPHESELKKARKHSS